MISAIVYALLVAVAAASGGIFKPGEWYEGLEKPGWTPPNWAFPVVWTTLYLMIGAAGWIVWRLDGFGIATMLWGAQLVFNAAWSYLFFGIRRMGWALVDSGAMWLTIAAFIVLAWPISVVAALLFVPYLAWVSVAFALNKRVMDLNPEAMAAVRASS
ncbi:MAG: TspO/MBR family protein [Roseitalea porphyridii]|uniref:TspO/MBR family protein n=1 Tax=Roseitalea porphyridii TaxID=1852022 RepID=UPI0032D9219C